MKILVVSARGFIGRHISALLAQLGHEIIQADIPKVANTNDRLFDPRNPDFEALFLAANVDVCNNCTGAASLPESFTNPLNYSC